VVLVGARRGAHLVGEQQARALDDDFFTRGKAARGKVAARLGARGIARKTFGEGDRPTNEPAGSGSGAAVDLDETPGAAARKYDRAFGDRDASLPVGQVGRRAQPL